MYFKFELGKCLKEKNISGYKLAKLTNKANQTIYRWIRNPDQISLKSYELICNVLECKLSDLIKEVE